MGFNSTMANREVCDLIFVDYNTKAPFLNLDFANTSSTELTGETVFAYGGKGHPKRVSFSGEKGGTLTIETQMQSVKLWQLLTGGTLSAKSKYVTREVLKVVDTKKVTLSEQPAEGSTVNIYKIDDDCGTDLKGNVSAKEVTITGEVSTGDTVVVYYTKEVSTGVQAINIKSTNFPKAFTVYGDTYMKTEEDDILPYRLIAYKCVPQSNMSLSFSNSGDPGTITITCDLMADKDNNILDLVLEDASVGA